MRDCSLKFAAALTGRKLDGNIWLLRFVALYTLILTAAYSAIPYKTPWCLLSFLHGMILMAGVGAVVLVKRLPTRPARVIACILLAVLATRLARQACRANFTLYADRRNPYVYAHTTTDVVRLGHRVEAIAQLGRAGQDMIVKVIVPGDDYWPLPWYLRRLPGTGYWSQPPDDPDAPVIIASDEFADLLDTKLAGRYQVDYYGLRPGVLLQCYIREDLWRAFIEEQTAPQE